MADNNTPPQSEAAHLDTPKAAAFIDMSQSWLEHDRQKAKTGNPVRPDGQPRCAVPSL